MDGEGRSSRGLSPLVLGPHRELVPEGLQLKGCVDVVGEEDVEDGAEEVVGVAEQEQEDGDGVGGGGGVQQAGLGQGGHYQEGTPPR